MTWILDKLFVLIKGLFGLLDKPCPAINFKYGISFPENEYCQIRTDRNTHRNCLFFRLGINNYGKQRIEEADVRVEKIELIDRDDNRQNISSSPFFLHWANENTDNSRSIYKNTPVFVDFLHTEEGHTGMAFFFFKQKHKSAGIKEFLTPGKWIVTVKLLGNNIDPVEKEIRVDFDGDWKRIKIRLL